VCDLEKKEEGQLGQCECGKNDGKECEWVEEEWRCECEFLIFGKEDMLKTIG
jgi:hypothetical protein